MELAGKHAVVTGGASGIGAAMARRFAAAGARVTVGDVDGAGAAAVAVEVDGVGAEVDVADEAQNRALVAAGEARFGPVDVFCANAGIIIAGDPFTDDASWDRMWSVNVRSHLYAVRAVLPGMLERGNGYLVHTASAAGLLTQLGSAPYAVTKHAVVALAEWLAITYGPHGIRVSVVAPQAVRTAMTAGIESGDSRLAVAAATAAAAAAATAAAVAGVDGMLEPEDVAEAVVAGMADERFLILPHPEVAEYMRRKANDPDRWIAGMQRLQARFGTAE